MRQTAEIVLRHQATLGEGALWNEKDQFLYWVDIMEQQVMIFDPATGDNRAISTGSDVGTVVQRESGGAMIAVRDGFASLDLETGADRGLVFDTNAADMVIRFAKVLRHTTGSMAGASLTLQPWQVFRHGSVFGWKHAETGLRRFRSTYHQVAKKNGKTTDTAVPMLYTQLFDGEGAPQGYCAATTRDQAGLLFNEIKRMIRGSSALSQLLDVYKTQIQSPRTNGYIAALSRDGNSADGINPHFAARDEFLVHIHIHTGIGRLVELHY